MKRILIIEPSRAVRETVAQLLARDYELEQRDGLLHGAALAGAAARADLVISSAGQGAWVSELARLKAPVILLAESDSAAQAFAGRGNFKLLLKPFNPYDFKTAVEALLNLPNLSPPAPVPPGGYLEYPYLSHGAARLAQRFGSLSLPLLIWGERGCGQDRVARAMLREAARAGVLVWLNAPDLTADDLKHQQEQLIALCAVKDSH